MAALVRMKKGLQCNYGKEKGTLRVLADLPMSMKKNLVGVCQVPEWTANVIFVTVFYCPF